MPQPQLEALIRAIHAQDCQLVLAITGGGSGAIGELLSVPGGSRTVLEALVPYSAAALDRFLGRVTDGYCSPRTAGAMAMAAFSRARELAADADPRRLCGIGCTASLVSDRPKAGELRAHVAWQTAAATKVYSLTLAKNLRNRVDEEQLVTFLVLHAVVEGIQMAGPRDFEGILQPGDQFEVHTAGADTDLQELMLGQRDRVWRGPAGEPPEPRVLFPGSFNPVHAGHRAMAAIAEQMLGAPCHFEISIDNVEKPTLDYLQIAQRRGGLPETAPVWLTRAVTFVRKAMLFPGVTFVVGIDTLVRIGEERFYGSAAERDAAIEQIAALGCRFLVFGRTLDGQFQTVDDVSIPTSLAALCRQVPAEVFREDLSSTDLRNGNGD